MSVQKLDSSTATAKLVPGLSTPHCNVSGRVFFITGGTQGLGLEVARYLKASGAAGLVLVSRSSGKASTVCEELTDESCRCVFVQADLSSAEEASKVIFRAAEAIGDVAPISGVVNAAATTLRGNLFTTTADDFDFQMALNARAPFLVTQAAAKFMVKKGVRGSIVNICSVASLGGAPFIMAYSAAKAALVTLTKNNAAELAPKGIRVNGVNMGWCLTENEDKLQRQQSGDAEWATKADSNVPLGRILRPADVAASVGFLLSDASAMMSGSVLSLHPEFPDGMLSLLAEDAR